MYIQHIAWFSIGNYPIWDGLKGGRVPIDIVQSILKGRKMN